MRNQKGFTLIELIIVIVVLGILAVTAAPQFINFSSDARTSTIEGLKGAAKGASQTVYAKSLVAGTDDDASGSITDPAVDTVYGYPAATAAGLYAALDVDSADWGNVVAASWSGNTAVTDGDLVIFPADLTTSADGSTDSECYLYYTAAADEDTKPVIGTVTTGC
ncbi:type II secretion system protein [Idiomarina piscisalsi]|uniref:type II secretion system protein n=1 Tax=Idiomarina piscisalsi TaxID=1096243 RepID=UPI001380C36E|nr:type II secretion system protein [Idiomarina piscisalsi]MTJ01464.1 type II secretion system protein [Idiomarina piscisalsi]